MIATAWTLFTQEKVFADTPVELVGMASIIALLIGAGAAIFAAFLGRQNRGKLNTPGEGTIGQKVQEMKDR